MIAFDSNILIYYLEDNPEFADKVYEVFLRIEKEGGVCSALLVTESFYGNTASFEQLGPLKNESVQIIALTKELAEYAGRLKLKHSLKNIDAIHLATALKCGADEFVTNDEAILKKKIPGLRINGIK